VSTEIDWAVIADAAKRSAETRSRVRRISGHLL